MATLKSVMGNCTPIKDPKAIRESSQGGLHSVRYVSALYIKASDWNAADMADHYGDAEVLFVTSPTELA